MIVRSEAAKKRLHDSWVAAWTPLAVLFGVAIGTWILGWFGIDLIGFLLGDDKGYRRLMGFVWFWWFVSAQLTYKTRVVVQEELHDETLGRPPQQPQPKPKEPSRVTLT